MRSFVFITLALGLLLAPREAFLTGAKPGLSILDRSILAPTLLVVADVGKQNTAIKIEKRQIEDPMLSGHGQVDHLVGNLSFEVSVKEVLFNSSSFKLAAQPLVFSYEIISDLLNYPAGSKLRTDRESGFKKELEYWPSRGQFIFRLTEISKGEFKLYAFSPIAELEAAKAFVSNLKQKH